MVDKAEQLIQKWAADPEKRNESHFLLQWSGTAFQEKHVGIRKLKIHLRSST